MGYYYRDLLGVPHGDYHGLSVLLWVLLSRGTLHSPPWLMLDGLLYGDSLLMFTLSVTAPFCIFTMKLSFTINMEKGPVKGVSYLFSDPFLMSTKSPVLYSYGILFEFSL